jgi:hypothetical protein
MLKETKRIEAGVALSITVDGRCAQHAVDRMRNREALNTYHYNLQLIRKVESDPHGSYEIRASEVRFLGPVRLVSYHDKPIKSLYSGDKLVAIETSGGIEYDIVTEV